MNTSISPQKIETHLKREGWEKRKEVQGVASLWFASFHGKKASILLPLDEGFADFEIKVEKIIKILSTVEEKTEEEIRKSLENISLS